MAKREDLTPEQQERFCFMKADLWIRRGRALKKRRLERPTNAALQALWAEEVIPDDVLQEGEE